MNETNKIYPHGMHSETMLRHKPFWLVLLLGVLLSHRVCADTKATLNLAEEPTVPACLYSLIGDSVHTQVYAFITDFLLNQKLLSSKELSAHLKEERRILAHNKTNQHKPDNLEKPYMACVVENSLSHTLSAFRKAFLGCKMMVLYQKQGLAVAGTGGIIFSREEEDPDIAIGYLGDDPSHQLGIRKLTGIGNGAYREVIMAINWDKHTGSSLSLSPAKKPQQTIGYLRTIIQISPDPVGAVIGDDTHTEVYPFITDFLLKQKALSSQQLKLLLEKERANLANNNNPSKTYLAEVKKNELSDILTKLRDRSRRQEEITLYQKQGLAVATTGIKDPICFQQEDIDDPIAIGYLGDDPSQQLGIRKLMDTEGREYQEMIMAINWDKTNSWGNYRASSLTVSLPQASEETIGYLRVIIQMIDLQ